MVQQGMIGDIHYVRAFWYRNSLDNDPAWRYAIPEAASPEHRLGCSWTARRSARSTSSDSTSGASIGIIRAASRPICWYTRPTSRTRLQPVSQSVHGLGGIYRWVDDDREVPDTFSALYDIRTNSTSTTVRTSATIITATARTSWAMRTMEVLNRQVLNFSPETFRGKAPERIKSRAEVHIDLPRNDNKAVEAHVRNLIEAVQGKAQMLPRRRSGSRPRSRDTWRRCRPQQQKGLLGQGDPEDPVLVTV